MGPELPTLSDKCWQRFNRSSYPPHCRTDVRVLRTGEFTSEGGVVVHSADLVWVEVGLLQTQQSYYPMFSGVLCASYIEK